MDVKAFALTMGIGAAAGAVAVMMMPRQNPARKLARQAAAGVENAVYRMTDKLDDMVD